MPTKNNFSRIFVFLLSTVFLLANLTSAIASEISPEEATKDMQLLDEAQNQLSTFRQANDVSYGLPSGTEKLELMLTKAKEFENKELAETQKLVDSIINKYQVKNLEELGLKVQSIVNPSPLDINTFPGGYAFIERDSQWIKELIPKLETALAKSKQENIETEAKLNQQKTLTKFPNDTYTGSDKGKIKQLMINALLSAGIIKSTNEILNISVTSDWKEGVYTDSKNTYRKIVGTVLFEDKDNDGISRYTSYIFMSDKTDSGWTDIKYKAFAGNPEGWAKPVSGTIDKADNESSRGIFWLLLSLANIVAGLLVAQEILKSKLTLIGKIISPLKPLSKIIGLTSLGLGLAGFILSLLSLNILSGIIPQLSAVILGWILAQSYLKEKASEKMKEQLDKQQASLQQINKYSQLIGLAGLLIGVLYLVLGGTFYII